MRLVEERDHRRLIARSIAERCGIVTLTPNSSTTNLTDARLRFDSVVVFMPTTANAAAEIANGTLWVAEAGRVNGSATIVHANNAQTDRSYRYLIG
jgi:hypothetical protein